MTPCGQGTPYEKILDGGQILFLGAGLESNTAFHTIEAICHAEYLLQAEPQTFTIIDSAGNTRMLPVRRHANGIARRFPALQPLLEDCGALHCGHVGPAASMLLEGRAFRNAMIEQICEKPDCLLESGAYENA
jgi:aminoglycoside N3'-acetyltransferase